MTLFASQLCIRFCNITNLKTKVNLIKYYSVAICCHQFLDLGNTLFLKIVPWLTFVFDRKLVKKLNWASV